MSAEPQKVYLTVREYTWGGEYGEEVIGVSATEAVAENVGQAYCRAEREDTSWARGRTEQINVSEWDVHGVVPPPQGGEDQ